MQPSLSRRDFYASWAMVGSQTLHGFQVLFVSPPLVSIGQGSIGRAQRLLEPLLNLKDVVLKELDLMKPDLAFAFLKARVTESLNANNFVSMDLEVRSNVDPGFRLDLVLIPMLAVLVRLGLSVVQETVDPRLDLPYSAQVLTLVPAMLDSLYPRNLGLGLIVEM